MSATGVIVRHREIPRLDPAVLAAFRRLGDLAGATSDAMDKLGIAGAIPAAVLRPQLPTVRMVGQAITLRNEPLQIAPLEAATRGVSQLALNDAHALAGKGDVLVIQGIDGVSSMGGNSARVGHAAGEAGAVVDGCVRDIDQSRSIGYPIWARGVSPITGKWRIRGAEINGPVTIAGVTVYPGDLVLADDSGVCFVPFARAAEVLRLAEEISAKDDAMQASIGVAEVDLDKA